MLRLPRLAPYAMCLACHHGSRDAFTLMTLAPRSASTCVPNGPATANPRSSTTTPSSGGRASRAAGHCSAATVDAAACVARSASVCSPTRGHGALDASRRLARGRRGCRPGAAGRARGADVDDRALGDRASGRRSASSGVRTGCSGTPASRADAHPVVAREARERLGHQRVVVREHDDVLGVGRDAVGIVADAVDVAPQRERVAVGAREHEAAGSAPIAGSSGRRSTGTCPSARAGRRSRCGSRARRCPRRAATSTR